MMIASIFFLMMLLSIPVYSFNVVDLLKCRFDPGSSKDGRLKFDWDAWENGAGVFGRPAQFSGKQYFTFLYEKYKRCVDEGDSQGHAVPFCESGVINSINQGGDSFCAMILHESKNSNDPTTTYADGNGIDYSSPGDEKSQRFRRFYDKLTPGEKIQFKNALWFAFTNYYIFEKQGRTNGILDCVGKDKIDGRKRAEKAACTNGWFRGLQNSEVTKDLLVYLSEKQRKKFQKTIPPPNINTLEYAKCRAMGYCVDHYDYRCR